MARPVAESSLKSEFNAFLFAPIGKNSDGMQVSVLSGLAQSELDPWAEAAELALLPVKNAVERLALLIGKMPDKGWAYPEPVAVATRLIALLPKQFSGATSVPIFGGLMNSKPWWVYVAIMSFVLGSQFLIASQRRCSAGSSFELLSIEDILVSHHSPKFSIRSLSSFRVCPTHPTLPSFRLMNKAASPTGSRHDRSDDSERNDSRSHRQGRNDEGSRLSGA
jgi:hypothetical protein